MWTMGSLPVWARDTCPASHGDTCPINCDHSNSLHLPSEQEQYMLLRRAVILDFPCMQSIANQNKYANYHLFLHCVHEMQWQKFGSDQEKLCKSNMNTWLKSTHTLSFMNNNFTWFLLKILPIVRSSVYEGTEFLNGDCPMAPCYVQQVPNTTGSHKTLFLLNSVEFHVIYILHHYHLWQSCVGRFRDCRDVDRGVIRTLRWGHQHRPHPHTWPGVTLLWPLIGQYPPILGSDWLGLGVTKWPGADCRDLDRDKSLQPRRWSHSWVWCQDCQPSPGAAH